MRCARAVRLSLVAADPGKGDCAMAKLFCAMCVICLQARFGRDPARPDCVQHSRVLCCLAGLATFVQSRSKLMRAHTQLHVIQILSAVAPPPRTASGSSDNTSDQASAANCAQRSRCAGARARGTALSSVVCRDSCSDFSQAHAARELRAAHKPTAAESPVVHLRSLSSSCVPATTHQLCPNSCQITKTALVAS